MRIVRVLTGTAIGTGVVLGVFFGVARHGVSAQSNPAADIVGVWRVSEVATTGPNARTVANPQPSVGIFTRRHFSAISIESDGPRPELPPIGKRTDQQVADAFDSFRAQAGTYEINGNEITYRVVTAKNPSAMRPGNFIIDTFRFEGRDTLWVTRKATDNGPAPNPTTWKLTRLE
jgi:hypothetical protein